MVERLVELEGDQVELETVDVVFGTDAPATPASTTVGFRIYRNGVEATALYQAFNNEQLNSISLGIAAYDGQIGMGTMTVPGTPGWRTGDRITFTDLDDRILYTGYVGNWGVSRNEASPTELESPYQLMDLNRQLIGRKLVEWTAGVAPSVVELGVAVMPSVDFVQVFIAQKMSDLTIDDTYLDPFGPVDMPVKSYTGDGFMDVGGDLILYTGKTFFMVPSQVENVPEFHFHELYPGPIYAGISVSDNPLEWDFDTVFPLTNPTKSMDASDLKNSIEGRNGTTTVAGMNVDSMTVHNAGGLKWEAVLGYPVSEDDLVTRVNQLLNGIVGAGDERATYTFSIEHIRGEQILACPAGSTIAISSDIIAAGAGARIAHETLTISRDKEGNPLPGFWDLALELGNPFRLPASIRGYGGQGGDSGALAAEFNIADHVNVTYPDQLPPVGVEMIVTGQIVSDIDAVVLNGDVEIFWTLEQWQDEAETVPSTAWSIDESSTFTNRFGVATVVLSHDTSGAWVKVRVKGEL